MSKSLKQQTREFFNQTKFVKCPAFPGEQITFNSKGINHLFYKGSRKARPRKIVASRIKLLPRAVELLKKMPIPQEEDNYTLKGKVFRFWAFEGVVQNRRIKVIIRQVGKGNKHFWSVIPSWRKTRFGIRNSRKRLSKI